MVQSERQQKRNLLDDITYNLKISLNEKDINVIKYICDCIGLSQDKIVSVPARIGDPQKMICIGHKKDNSILLPNEHAKKHDFLELSFAT